MTTEAEYIAQLAAKDVQIAQLTADVAEGDAAIAAMLPPVYVPIPFPRRVTCGEASHIVNSQEELDALGEGWA